MTHKIISADILAALADMPDNSFDGCFCDPPYELGFMGKGWDKSGIAFQPATWAAVLRVLKPGAHLMAFGGTRTYHRLTCAIEDAGFEVRDSAIWAYGSGFPKSYNLKGVWSGYGTAIKPAYEPCIIARKPLDGTVAHNADKWGVGALWIDGGRVGHDEECRLMTPSKANIERPSEKCRQGGRRAETLELKPSGRWPANILHDDSPEVADALGYAARFFYCAKASSKERNAGLSDFAEQACGGLSGRNDGSLGKTTMGRNPHPCVKPLALCEYLSRLILPPAGRPHGLRRLLVPFSGSGSEMVGALKAGWDEVTGIERETDYAAIADARLAHHIDQAVGA